MSSPCFLPPIPLPTHQLHARHSPKTPPSCPTRSPRKSQRLTTPLATQTPPPSQTLQPTTRNPDWMFYDVARVLVQGGNGGNGIVAFRREKGVPRGGPAGGSGGPGGSVIFIASPGANTLSKFRGGIAFRAQHGNNGVGKARTGQGAKDMQVFVPLGTVVRTDKGRVLADLSRDGQRFCVAKGGRGGRGNLAFKTDKNRTPRICERGEPGVRRWITLELKLVADVALVGFPNAGKSTLLDAVSNARPKIADYPFTTIVPNLGVVEGDQMGEGGGLVVADVPGLIEGAHRGIGMGVAFLRHVERCKVVVHILDASVDRMVDRYKAIRFEMEMFDERLARKKEVVLVNKVDLPGVREKWNNGLKEQLIDAVQGHKRIALVSARSKEGLAETMRRVSAIVQTVDDQDNIVVLGDEDGLGEEPAAVAVEDDGVFRVSGYKVKRAFQMTNWDYAEGIDRFQRILQALGVNKLLEEEGVKDGDLIRCFDREFEYYGEENIYSYAAALDGYTD